MLTVTKTNRLALVTWILAMLVLLPAGTLAQEAPTPVPPGPTLDTVLTRGQIICGVNQDIFGFGFLNPNTGSITGLYVDFCRALAAAVFGDSVAVELRLLPVGSPPDLLVSGELDVMMVYDNIQAFSRDSTGGLAFGPPFFYDGQSFMVRAESQIAAWEDLDDQSICVTSGRQQANLVAALSERGLTYDLLTFESAKSMQDAFLAGQCNVQSLDRSLLEIRRQSTDDPRAFVVWDIPFTRRVVSPLYRYGDQQWANIVNWTAWGLIQAEALGISSDTLAQFLRREGENDEIYTNRVGRAAALMVDSTLGLGGQIGLSRDFMAAVIRQVGNYGEIYNRNLGPQSALPMARAWNALWTKDGLLFAPPWE